MLTYFHVGCAFSYVTHDAYGSRALSLNVIYIFEMAYGNITQAPGINLICVVVPGLCVYRLHLSLKICYDLLQSFYGISV